MSPDIYDGKLHHRPLPSDDLLSEQAYLVSRGVRRVAIVGSCSPDEAQTVRHRLLTLTTKGALPFVAALDDDWAICGYATHEWAFDLLIWAYSVPQYQKDRILGLLLGYSGDAIRDFEELGRTMEEFHR